MANRNHRHQNSNRIRTEEFSENAADPAAKIVLAWPKDVDQLWQVEVPLDDAALLEEAAPEVKGVQVIQKVEEAKAQIDLRIQVVADRELKHPEVFQGLEEVHQKWRQQRIEAIADQGVNLERVEADRNQGYLF